MKSYIDILALPITASAAISANTFVGFDGAPCGADAVPFGQAHYDQAIGRDVACTVLGVAVVKATGAIAKGARLVTVVGGGVQTAPGNAVNPFGRALDAVADGEQVRILMR